MMHSESMFLYLNLEHAWPLFQLDGLVIDRGSLHLTPLPGNPQQVGTPLHVVSDSSLPAGIGVDTDGTLYIAEPGGNRVLRVDGCDGRCAPFACLSGPGSALGQLREPRGVLVGKRRRVLYIADSGNYRIQLIDLPTGQPIGVWGQPNPWGEPEPSDEPGRFQKPWDLVADKEGNVYVSDPGTRDAQELWQGGRIQKFDSDGVVDAGFWVTMQGQPETPSAPHNIFVASLTEGESQSERLLVLDRQPVRLLVYRLDGQLDLEATARWLSVADLVAQPSGLAYARGFVYVGDASVGRLRVFDAAGNFAGFARGDEGSIAGLALDSKEHLLVHPGGGIAVRRLQLQAAYREEGRFLAGPFEVDEKQTVWNRLSIEGAPLTAIAHFQLYTLTTDNDAPPALPGTDDVTPWQAAPRDAFDLLVGSEPGRFLWLAGVLLGDGSASSRLSQMRLDYDQEGWLQYLPALYRREGDEQLLKRSLALFESLLDDVEDEIDDLPRLFDPRAATDACAPHSWLDWLSGWLGFDLGEAWKDEKRRSALAEAFSLYGRRGTVEGLRRFISLYANARVLIEEPARFASLWSLGETSTLGFSTMLAATEPQGATLDTTALLDHSHLIAGESPGAPLFEDLAHHFCVEVYQAELYDSGAVQQVRQVIENEKPAHTTYHLCLIGARMRVGFQARLGIDAIVGGEPPDLTLGAPQQLGLETFISGSTTERRVGGALGQDAWIGRRTTLT